MFHSVNTKSNVSRELVYKLKLLMSCSDKYLKSIKSFPLFNSTYVF